MKMYVHQELQVAKSEKSSLNGFSRLRKKFVPTSLVELDANANCSTGANYSTGANCSIGANLAPTGV
jgi:hypothetical protein